MSQFADGGVIASKPYVSSGAYINRMSDYCKGCHYKVSVKTGEGACPFNLLYWHFLDRHRERFSNNARMGNMYRTWDRMDADRRETVLAEAEAFLERLDDGAVVCCRLAEACASHGARHSGPSYSSDWTQSSKASLSRAVLISGPHSVTLCTHAISSLGNWQALIAASMACDAASSQAAPAGTPSMFRPSAWAIGRFAPSIDHSVSTVSPVVNVTDRATEGAARMSANVPTGA